MTWLARRLNKRVGVPEDWYSVKRSDFLENFGGPLLLKYSNSPYQLLASLYPNETWHPWLFSFAPRGIWKDQSNHLKFLEYLAGKLNFKSPEDYYKLNSDVICEHGGEGLIKIYGSYQNLIMEVIADHKFLEWKFPSVPTGFFYNIKNRKRYIEWLKETVGVSDDTELTQKHFFDNHGGGLLMQYAGSPSKVISSLYLEANSPNTESNSKKLHKKEKYTFDSLENQKEYANQVAKKMGFDFLDEEKWYTIRIADLMSVGKGGKFLHKHYRSSTYLFLKAILPDIDWKPWKFNKFPHVILQDTDALRKIVQYVEFEVPIRSNNDWKRISDNQLKKLRVKTLFERAGGIEAVLRKVYPDADWTAVFSPQL